MSRLLPSASGDQTIPDFQWIDRTVNTLKLKVNDKNEHP